MKTTILGKKSPLTVRSVGLGCMGMVSAYPPIPDKQDMVRFVREAVGQGALSLTQQRSMGRIPARRSWARPWRASGIRW